MVRATGGSVPAGDGLARLTRGLGSRHSPDVAAVEARLAVIRRPRVVHGDPGEDRQSGSSPSMSPVYPPMTSAFGVLVWLSAARRVRTVPQATSVAATTVSVRPATETASRNCMVCCVLQFDVAMSPVKIAARMVPVTATPTPVATSEAVSTSAAPIDVRFSGRPRSTFVPATTPFTRIPAATRTSAIAIHRYPKRPSTA